MTLLIIVLILFILNWNWAKWLFNNLLKGFWKRSTLRVVCEVSGKKAKSWKDEILTKKNKVEEPTTTSE